MTSEILELNIDELNAVSGGATTVNGTNNVTSASNSQPESFNVRKAGGEHMEYLRYVFTVCMLPF